MPELMEPYRIKVVEPLSFPTKEERAAALVRSGYNLFNLRSEEVVIDLLTDSGTSAMSAEQWAMLFRGDESYAGSASFERFAAVVRELTGYEHIIPTHQGRAAERILFSTVLGPGKVSLSNTHFDTTRANVELTGAEAVDLPSQESRQLQSEAPFKGNIDLEALERALSGAAPGQVVHVIMTITNNAGGGQPVSMANLRAVRALCDRHDVPMFLDACRFAENAWLVIQREPDQAGRLPRDVAKEAFRLADGCTISLKKDGIANIGGLLAVNDSELARQCTDLLIATEGFTTYGGLAGRDLDAIAQGLVEVTEPPYLRARAAGAAYLAQLANDAGVQTVRPAGCHAVYVDAGTLLPHIPAHAYPAHALACELYLEGGIRSVELGTLLFGKASADGLPDLPAPHELLRLALPRRVYTQSHLDYVGEVLAAVAKRAPQIPGYRIVSQPPTLRHFSAQLEPLR